MRRFAWLAVALFALSLPAFAEGDKAEEAKAHFLSGQAAYDKRDYEKAIAEFEEAYRLHPSPAYLYNIAVAYELWGKPDKAAEYYERYAPSAPAAEREQIAAKIKALRPGAPEKPPEKPEDKPAEKPKTILEVKSEPDGAEIWLEERRGDPVGRTPYRGEIEPGKHTIFIEKKGYLALTRSFDILYGQTTSLDIALEKADSPIVVAFQANVVGAQVYIDDRSQGIAGTTPFQMMLAPGKHTAIIEKEGYEPLTKEFELDPKNPGPIPIALELKEGGYGRLKVTSNLKGAQVEIDGKRVGAVPFGSDLPKIGVGEHRIRVSSPGYHAWEGTLEVVNGQTVQVKTELVKTPSKAGGLIALLIAGGFGAAGGLLGTQAQERFDSIQADIDAGLPVDDSDPRFRDGFVRGLAADVAFGLAGVSFIVSVGKLAAKGSKKSKGEVFNSVSPVAGSGGVSGGSNLLQY
jgi:tetratricopeptide (TPR) repeat protein